MILPLIAAVLFLYTAYRFVRRLSAETRRQEMITWPTAAGRMELEDISLVRDRKSGIRSLARVEGGYKIYAQGQAFTGDRLLPDSVLIDEDERYDIEQWLTEQEEIPVHFNPKEPQDNTILVGHNGLDWWRMYVYIFFGVALPGLLIYLHFVFYSF